MYANELDDAAVDEGLALELCLTRIIKKKTNFRVHYTQSLKELNQLQLLSVYRRFPRSREGGWRMGAKGTTILDASRNEQSMIEWE